MTDHVALVFPGRRYGPQLPLLRYPAQALAQRGAQVRVVNYPELLLSAEAPDEQQWQQVVSALTAAVAEHVSGAARVTLLAKSLGTRVIARLPHGLLPDDVGAVWLTPIFVDPVTVRAAAASPWRSLYVHGTADPACDPAALREVVAATGGDVVAIIGGDHSLDVEGDVLASVDALRRVTTAVLELAGR